MREPSVLVIGAGMSGIGMAVKLRNAGITDLVVAEKADRIGGTWRDNVYPGLTCDIAAVAYQYSFALNPDWSHYLAPGDEIRRYLEKVVDDHGLRHHLRLGHHVTRARFADGKWHVETAGGQTFMVDFLVSATGLLHHPRIPDLTGLEDFAGPVFHSARWDDTITLSGRRVAVVGTGSSGVQLVDALAGTAGRLLVFQRTAQWILPLPNWRTGRLTHAIRRRFPAVRRGEHRLTRAVFRWLFSRAATEPGWRRRLIAWLCRRNLNQVTDPDLRRRLTPDYAPLCRRIPVSTGFYRAVRHPSVHVVTGPIDHVTPRGIVTADGEHHDVDVIILATGFHAHSYLRPVELVNADGRTLSQAWQPGPYAYRSVAHPDFPNFFMLVGPHSPVATDAITTIAETQADFVLHWIEQWQRNGFTTIAPTHTATERYNRELRAALGDTVWSTGCGGWYLDQHGLPDTWPWRVEHYAAQLESLNPNDFDVR